MKKLRRIFQVCIRNKGAYDINGEINPTDKETDDVEKHWPQIIAILIGSISGFTDGLHFSWASPFIVKITEDKENYDVTEEEASYFNTLHPVAFLIGSPIFSFLCCKFGRKKTFLSIAFLHILGWLFAAFAKDVYLFYLSRICAGLAYSCFSTVFPIYVGEIANPTVRGSWGNAIATSIYFGEFAINVIGSYFGVKQTSFICLPLPVIFFVLFSIMPESPYYLIIKEKEDEAKQSLQFFTRKRNVEMDYLKLKSDVDRQLSESGTWSDLFKIKSNRKAVTAGTFLRFTQQASGLNVFCMFTQTIFVKSGQDLSRELSSIIVMAVNFVLIIFMVFFIVHRFSRKKLYIISMSSSGVVLFILGTYFYVNEYSNLDLSSFKWVPITGIILYFICASFGICVIPILMLSELFSTSITAKAMTVLGMFTASGNILINWSFYYIIEYLGFFAIFYVFAICNVVSTVFSFYVIPETKGKTLEEIQQEMKKM